MKSALLSTLAVLAIGFLSIAILLHLDTLAKRQQVVKIQAQLDQLPTQVDVPEVSSGLSTSLATQSAMAVLMRDLQTGMVLYEKGADQPRYPASTAKMMTALVARKLYSLDQVMTVRDEAFADGSVIGFQLGERVRVRDLLAVLLIHSGNDAALVLANNAPGGYVAFVAEMNAMARQLGLRSTVFVNASGLDEPAQQTTATDLERLGEELLRDPVLADLVKTKRMTVTDVSGKLRHPLVNRNELLELIPGVFGIKTGTTDSAGENLVTAVERRQRPTLLVLLGSQSRYTDAVALINWLDESVRWRTVRAPER